MKHEQKAIIALLLLYFGVAIFLIFNFKGVGTEADSISHYLIAKYALQHPELFLDHWGKPLFTLLASPFAQFGFKGIKIFNILCVGANLLLIFRVSKLLHFKWPILACLFYLLFPLTLSTTFSGLTEPLMGFFLLGSLLLLLQRKEILALTLISFTPFIRSEGLVIILTFAIFQSINGKWKSLPYLLVGHLIFMLIGAFYYQDLLWVFNLIPYASLNSPYGSGDWFHFFDKMTYVMGVPLMILFWIGLLLYSWQGVKKGTPLPPKVLIPACFTAFFIAHTVFWKFGIFNSMGLKRVFAAITPLMALMALYAFENGNRLASAKWIKPLQIVYLLYILIFPFTSNPAATEFKRDLSLTKKQKSLANFEIEPAGKRLVYADPYLSLRCSVNPFNSKEYLQLHLDHWNKIKSGDLIIWDNWHAEYESGLSYATLEKMVKRKQLKKVTEIKPYYALYLKP